MKAFRFTLTHDATPLILTYNPEEWSELGLKIARHKRYKAVWTSFSNESLTFKRTDDGAGFIKSAFDADGFDFEMSILIEWLNPESYTYETFFSGVIDSDTYKEIDDTEDVQVSIIESSAAKKLADREEINYDVLSTVTADGATAETISTIPKSITFKESDIFTEAAIESNRFIHTTDGAFNTGYLTESTYINTIGSDLVNPQTTSLLYTNTGTASQTFSFSSVFKSKFSANERPSWFYRMDQAGTFFYSATFNYSINGGSTVNVMSQSGSTTYFEPGNNVYEYMDIEDVNLEVTLNAGATLEFWGVVHYSFVTSGFSQVSSSDLYLLDINILLKKTSGRQKPVDSVLLYEAGAKLADMISGSGFYSEELGRTDSQPLPTEGAYSSDGDYSLYCVLSGFLLRQFPIELKRFSINFKDYWQSISSVFALAMQYNTTLDRFEVFKEIDSFDDTTKIATLDNVRDLEIYPAKEFIFNEIKTGYKDKVSYENENGSQEYNTPVEFEEPISAINGTKDIQCIYHGDGLGMTFASTAGADTDGSADTRYDPITFIHALRRGAGITMVSDRDEDFSSITGVYGVDTRLNCKITPKRNLLRHSQISTPLCKKSASSLVRFRQSQNSIPLSTQLTTESTPIVELANEEKQDLISSKVEPIFYKFDYPISPSLLSAIQADKNGYFEFPTRKGEILSGYIYEITMNNYDLNSEFILIKKA